MLADGQWAREDPATMKRGTLTKAWKRGKSKLPLNQDPRGHKDSISPTTRSKNQNKRSYPDYPGLKGKKTMPRAEKIGRKGGPKRGKKKQGNRLINELEGGRGTIQPRGTQ